MTTSMVLTFTNYLKFVKVKIKFVEEKIKRKRLSLKFTLIMPAKVNIFKKTDRFDC